MAKCVYQSINGKIVIVYIFITTWLKALPDKRFNSLFMIQLLCQKICIGLVKVAISYVLNLTNCLTNNHHNFN